MRLPRDLSGDELIKGLRRLGYQPTRQTGSHARLTRESCGGVHRITIPRHNALRLGTLSRILSEVAEHLGIAKGEVLRRMRR